MSSADLLTIHACGATIALLSGYLAMVLRKGSGTHRVAGNIFFVSMLVMTTCAGYVAFGRLHMANALNSVLTFYLVVTAWLAAKRSDGKTGVIDVVALLVVLAVGASLVFNGFEAANSANGRKDGYPAALYFIFGTIALLHAASDIRMLVRGGVTGKSRIARHLWRMSFALLFTTLSFYPGQPRLVAQWLQETKLIFVPHVLLVGAMIFWIVRIGRGKRIRREAVMAG